MGYYTSKKGSKIWDGFGIPQENDISYNTILHPEITRKKELYVYKKCPECSNIRWVKVKYINNNATCYKCSWERSKTKPIDNPKVGDILPGRLIGGSKNTTCLYIYTQCVECKTLTWIPKSKKDKTHCAKCTRRNTDLRKAMEGTNKYRYTHNGYTIIAILPNDPIYHLFPDIKPMNTFGTKHVQEHRYNYTRFLNRPLTIDEEVHHIEDENGQSDRTNNDISNLELLDHKTHRSLSRVQKNLQKKTNEIIELRKQLEELRGQTNVVGIPTQVVQHSPETIL